MGRRDVRFASGPLECAGWWYSADGATERGPVIVMAHGLGATKDMRLDAYAQRFVAEGFHVLAFDYRHFGQSDGEPRELLDISRQLDDWAAALHWVRAVPGVDPAKIVLWGTSFSGGHVLEVAKRDGDVAAVISQAPFTDGFASLRTLGLISLVKVLVKALRDAARGATGRSPVRVQVAGRRREAALMTKPDVYDGYRALVPAGVTLHDQVPARIALRIPFYYPGRAASEMDCPALFCVAMDDSVAPASATIWHARQARKGHVKRYRTGHFDIYQEPWFDTVIADQIEFLRSEVPGLLDA